MKLTVEKLLRLFDNNAIINSWVNLYPSEFDKIDSINNAINDLRLITPEADKQVKEVCVSFDYEQQHVSVLGRAAVKSTLLTLELLKWKHWLGAKVVIDESFARLFDNEADIDIREKNMLLTAMTYILCEMTFLGFSERQIDKRGSNVIESVNEIRDIIDTDPY